MYNKSQFSKDRKLAKEPKHVAKPKDVDYVSMMGYRDDSPFNTRPYIDINTPNGLIDMSNTGVPLLANGKFLAPYSGLHQFDTNTVREIPLAEEGGTILELTDDEIKKYRDAGYVVDLTPYPERHNPANSFPVTDPRSMQDGGNFYTLKGSKGVYRKVGDNWEVDWNRTGNFQPISKGNVKERVSNLNKNAQPLYDRDYVGNFNWNPAPTAPKVNKPLTAQEKKAQELFDTKFKVTKKSEYDQIEDEIKKEQAQYIKQAKDLGVQADPKDLEQISQRIWGTRGGVWNKRPQDTVRAYTPEKPQGLVDKAFDIAGNPMTAAGFLIRGQAIPDYMQRDMNRGTFGYWANGVFHTERNPFDIPLSDMTGLGLLSSARNVYNTATDDVSGNFWTGDNALELFNIIPAYRALKGIKSLPKSPQQLPGSPNAGLSANDVVLSRDNINLTAKEILKHDPTMMDIRAERLAALQTSEGKARLNQYLKDNAYLALNKRNMIDQINMLRPTKKTMARLYGMDNFVPTYDDVLSGIADMEHASEELIKNHLAYEDLKNAYKAGTISQEVYEEGIKTIKEMNKSIKYEPDNAYMYSGLLEPGVKSTMNIGSDLTPLDAKIAGRHEMGHYFQAGNKSHLDKELENITLNTSEKPLNDIKFNESFLSTKWKGSSDYMKKSRNYWTMGSSGQEKTPFMEEVRAVMLEDGTINNIYDPITPEMLESQYKKYRQGQTAYPLRIFDIMENTPKNFKIMSSVLNKMPMAIPAAIGLGAAGSLAEQRKGGYVSKQITHFQDGGNTDPGNNALELHMFYDKHNVKAEGGTVLELTKEEIKRYRDAGYVIIED